MISAHPMLPEAAANILTFDPQVTGITISGGEPTLQAINLAAMLRIARRKRDLHVICFTGYEYETLLERPASNGIQDLLNEVDLLIDGPYERRLNNGMTFAGSSNQRMIFLSERPIPDGEKWDYRKVELHIRNGKILVVGIPPLGWNRNWIASTFNKSQMLIGENL